MADTIDVYGDEVVLKDLVERDIATYEDSVIELIGNCAFANCKSLTSLNLSTASQLSMFAFMSCTNLISVDLPSVTEIGASAFSGCSNLSTVNMPMLSDINQYAFAKCGSLESLNFPKAQHIVNYAFGGCSNLTSLSIPECQALWSNAFSDCNKLSQVFITGSQICALKYSNVFTNCPIGKSSYLGYFGSVYVPSSLVDTYKSATNWTYYADRITAYEGE